MSLKYTHLYSVFERKNLKSWRAASVVLTVLGKDLNPIPALMSGGPQLLVRNPSFWPLQATARMCTQTHTYK